MANVLRVLAASLALFELVALPSASSSQPATAVVSIEKIGPLIRSRADKLDAHHATGKLPDLLKHLAEVPENVENGGPLQAIKRGFVAPLELPVLERTIADKVARTLSGGLLELFELIDFAFDNSTIKIEERKIALDARLDFDSNHEAARSLAKDLLWNIAPPDENLVRHLAFIVAAPEIRRISLETMYSTRNGIEKQHQLLASHAKDAPISRDKLPPELAASIRGEVLFFERTPQGKFAVVGGTGDNSYAMSDITSVYETGGNDTYRFAEPSDGGRCPNHLIWDVAGNDRYLGEADFCGPGVGQFGFAMVDDSAGNDRYTSSRQFSMAAGLFGIGITIDRAGNDRYENSGPYAGWAQGAGFYGAGISIDLAGDDEYNAQKYSQGAGGASGLGLLIDAAGRDVYRANGRDYPSAYGDHGVYSGMSQGFGFGIRKLAPGGIGGLYDFSGDDRFEGGEFTQASAYYWGLGILHDFSGNDLYYASRFGQSAGAHRALSVFVDEAGSDTYWGMTSSSQAGPWDESVAFLIDRAGNDSYRCDELCQGAAAQQSLGVLIDLQGDDHYNGASTHAVGGNQGSAGENSYHYATSKAFSFGALFDLGRGKDFYSAGKQNNSTSQSRILNQAEPGESRQTGLFVDE